MIRKIGAFNNSLYSYPDGSGGFSSYCDGCLHWAGMGVSYQNPGYYDRSFPDPGAAGPGSRGNISAGRGDHNNLALRRQSPIWKCSILWPIFPTAANPKYSVNGRTLFSYSHFY